MIATGRRPAARGATTPQTTPGTTPGPAALRSQGGLRSLGVEEEFHLVDLTTRRVSPRAAELLWLLDGGPYVAEMQSCMVETNTDVVLRLTDLRAELIARRAVLRRAARQLGLGVVAAGTVPLTGSVAPPLTDRPRYRWMREEYAVLASEQLICGTQVHAEVPDRDEAVAAAALLAPYLPVLLALSTSSPFDPHGTDSGYASSRTLVWSRWPTTGGWAGARTAAEYDALVAALVESGVALDEGMMYFDIRPALVAPTLELRICDSCPSVDTIVLIAGLFRALVDRAVDQVRDGIRPEPVAPELGRAATWRAARSGLEGQLIDPATGRPGPATEVVTDLLAALEPQLRRTGDWRLVSRLARTVLAAGSSADRQRRALAVRGRLSDVVDLLLAETASAPGPVEGAADDGPDIAAGEPPEAALAPEAEHPAADPIGETVTYRCPVGCGRFAISVAGDRTPTLFRCPRCGGPATRTSGHPQVDSVAGGAASPGRFGWRPRPPRPGVDRGGRLAAHDAST